MESPEKDFDWFISQSYNHYMTPSLAEEPSQQRHGDPSEKCRPWTFDFPFHFPWCRKKEKEEEEECGVNPKAQITKHNGISTTNFQR
jgi:hypothetical protein